MTMIKPKVIISFIGLEILKRSLRAVDFPPPPLAGRRSSSSHRTVGFRPRGWIYLFLEIVDITAYIKIFFPRSTLSGWTYDCFHFGVVMLAVSATVE
jgi:hypothetical protein